MVFALHSSKHIYKGVLRGKSTFIVKKWSLPKLSALKKSSSPLEWSYLMGPSDKPLLGLTVGQTINRAADLFGDQEAIVSRHQTIRKSFTQVNEESDKLAAGFLALGFQHGDRIGIWGPNSYEWYLTQFASAKAGLVLVNINPSYRPNELKYCLNKVSLKGIICAEKYKTSNYYEMLSSAMPELASSKPGQLESQDVPSLRTVITLSEDPASGTMCFKDVIDAGGSEEGKEISKLSKLIQFDEPYNIQFTSGTTGLPKGALLSHHNVVNNANNFGRRFEFENQPLRLCIGVPLYHCFGCVLGVICATIYGCTSIFANDGFDPRAIVEAIEEEQLNSIYGTPTMFVDILNEFKRNPVNVDSLITGAMAGAPCPEELVNALMNELNMKKFLIAYGMTETSPVTFQCFPSDPPSIRAQTIGFPTDHTEVKIVDENGRIVPVGEIGELCVRGYCNFLGYWGDDDKTAEILGRDRWLKTGDLATLNKDGYGAIIGRLKDMIIRGGENIYPAEIENFYMSHPDVLEAQAFGVPDRRMGEEVAMWFRKRLGSNLDAATLKEWSKGKIAHFKIPRYMNSAEEFPVTVTGKIQKFKMREILIKEMGFT